jgi:hypothetical protein
MYTSSSRFLVGDLVDSCFIVEGLLCVCEELKISIEQASIKTQKGDDDGKDLDKNCAEVAAVKF